MSITITPIPGVPLIKPNDNLPALLLEAIRRLPLALEAGDILVVCQKVVSKAEGRIVDLKNVEASDFAKTIAAKTTDKDPRAVEVILRQADRIVRMDRGHLIVETGPGWVCANAGVDESNNMGPDTVILLPVDPDASAERIRKHVREGTGVDVPVIISDTFGRAWREGLLDVALGVAGMDPFLDERGQHDLNGRELHHTVMAAADALAAAAGLVMRKDAAIAAAHVRGYQPTPGDSGGRRLVRSREFDLFR
jgi:coenzyme F420-0:L-glutamate ligase/coenzyme F420-1:gamma-L-glutamate ligase